MLDAIGEFWRYAAGTIGEDGAPGGAGAAFAITARRKWTPSGIVSSVFAGTSAEYLFL